MRYSEIECEHCKKSGVLQEQVSNPHWLECNNCNCVQPNPLNNNSYFPEGNLAKWMVS